VIVNTRRPSQQPRIIGRADGLTDTRIRALLEDRNGSIWFGGNGGLYHAGTSGRTDNAGASEVIVRRYTSELTTDNVGALWQDANGVLWVGMKDGSIGTTKEKKLVRWGNIGGSLPGGIWGFAEGDGEILWVGTQKGLFGMDTRTGAVATQKTELMGNPVFSCQRAHDGSIAFVSDEGFEVFNPSLMNRTIVPPPVSITAFTVSGQEMRERDGLEFSSTENNCVIEFVGISFRSEGGMRYQYKLEPADRYWRDPTASRSVSFAALQPGTYRFSVRAMTVEGAMSTTPATLRFTILPPYWQTWWFFTLVTLSIAGMLTGAYRYRVKRLLELERLRGRIATDLHDEIGSTLSGISVLSETAKRELSKRTPKAARHLDRIGSSARMMLDAMDDIVWTINPQHDSLEQFIFRLREFAAEMFEAKKIAFDLHVPEQTSLTLPMEM
ncbi:MAG: histidine kinase, partial [Bacteroidota bacterium]